MSTTTRPFTSYDLWRDDNGKPVDTTVCAFCRQPCIDQTLISWEPCCTQFEMALLLDDVCPGDCPSHAELQEGCSHCEWSEIRRLVCG